jgi:MFS family permease
MDRPDAAREQRDLRAILGDGVSFSLMVGLGESYLPAFVLAAGHGAVAAGLVATLPMLAGAVLQLVSPWAVRHLRSHRRWVVLCALLQAASLLPLALGATRGGLAAAWLYLAATAYWGFGMATGPAWNSWVETLVPAPRRALFFARRSRWCQVAVLTGVVAGGTWLHANEESGRGLLPFAVLFGCASLARIVSARFLASQSETGALAEAHRRVSPADFARQMRASPGGRLVGYLLCMQAAVNLSAPYFTPFLLGPLGLSYGRFTLLTATAFVARVVALPALGRTAQGAGTRRVLWAGALGIVPLPALWLLSDAFAYLVVIQILGGVAWAALELAILLSIFEHIDPRERVGVLTLYNLANAGAVAGGALAGAWLFDAAGGGRGGFLAVFALSTASRAFSLAALRRAPDVTAPEHPLELRTLAVRPAGGAVQRPVLPTAESGPE